MAFTADVQARFDALFRGLLPLIEERLLGAGEVEPFGVTLDANGDGSIVAIRGLDLAVEKVQVVRGRAVSSPDARRTVSRGTCQRMPVLADHPRV